MKKLSLTCLIAFAMLLALLGGCATRTPAPDVGAVVVVPQVKLPDLPAIVQETQPKPTGYFQRTLLDYFNGSPVKLTPSAMHIPAAELKPSQ